MSNNHLFRPFLFAILALALMLSFVDRAFAQTTVLTNLSDSNNTPNGDSAFIGEAFVDGTASSYLDQVVIQLFTTAYTPVDPELELETRNADGTVGATQYTISGTSNFSYSSGLGQLTFVAPSSFLLSATQGYFLVLSDTGSAGATVNTTPAHNASYTAQGGFTIPTTDTVFFSSTDNTATAGYYPAAGGPEKFSLTVTAVPEPASFILLGMGIPAMVAKWRRRSS